ncbi:hypothetical protein CSC2_50800 [Clostridium zeae]|uniref:Methyl-accepting transducer domain-containing protein n=1 Tax=Clostridium zeae TaxID=2759022 RepID=A0ABQ1EIM5_9CLOT|nr:hypothetical protein [Clostridium zeae]GFZ34554.1 hypothetical protein CSC2_50800 [Clostridium zeae]
MLGVKIIKINDITNYINNISEQTNLLALNAASEEMTASSEEVYSATDEVAKSAAILDNATEEMMLYVSKFRLQE